MGILSWILLGLVAGALAKFIIPGKQPGGCFTTIVIGVVGALVGGYLASLMGIGTGIQSFDLGSVIVSTGGAIILLIIYGLISKK